MLTAPLFSASGEQRESFELPQDPFDGVVHEQALHQVVKAHLANQRQGTASTKSRGEVSGGGKKVWRQKGTGRARQGSIRAPHWRGGGIAFGPTPRSYHQDVPKRLRALARRSAFNTRALKEQVAVIEGFEIDTPKTKAMREVLAKMGADGRKILILTEQIRPEVILSVRNLPNVRVLPYREASAYDVLNANQLVIESAALNAQPAAAATEG